MKLSRIVASGAAFSLIAASVLLGASAANAGTFWVDGQNLPAEADSPTYIDGWFHGTVTNSPGSYLNTANGLQMIGGAQLLNGDTPRTGLEDLVDSAYFGTDSGNVTFQISIFTSPNASDVGFTTLRPVSTAFGVPGSSTPNMWEVSRAFGGGAIVTTDTYSIDQLVAEMATDYEILAFGVFVNPGDTAVLRGILWNDNYYDFMPKLGTISPSTVTISELAATGVTLNMTGIPGVDILVCSVYAMNSDAGSIVGEVEVAVGQDGTATYVFTGPAPVGDYVIECLSPLTDDWGAYDFFSVTADPAVVQAQLPATGPADVTPFVLGGGLLLLLGAGATVFAVRRKQALSA